MIFKMLQKLAMLLDNKLLKFQDKRLLLNLLSKNIIKETIFIMFKIQFLKKFLSLELLLNLFLLHRRFLSSEEFLFQFHLLNQKKEILNFTNTMNTKKIVKTIKTVLVQDIILIEIIMKNIMVKKLHGFTLISLMRRKFIYLIYYH